MVLAEDLTLDGKCPFGRQDRLAPVTRFRELGGHIVQNVGHRRVVGAEGGLADPQRITVGVDGVGRPVQQPEDLAAIVVGVGEVGVVGSDDPFPPLEHTTVHDGGRIEQPGAGKSE